MSITFNDKHLPNNVTITEVSRSVMPTKQLDTFKIYGRDGLVGVSETYNARTFEIEFQIEAENDADYFKAVEDLARFLHTEPDENPQLWFEENPDRYYFAKVQGDTTVTEVLYERIGKVKVTLLCVDPFAYPVVMDENTIDVSGSAIICNKGDVKSFPSYEIHFTGSTTIFQVTNSVTGEYIRIGNNIISGDKTAFALYTNQITLTMSDPALADVTKMTLGSYFDAAADGDITSFMLRKTRTIAGTSQYAYGLDDTDSWGTYGTTWYGAGIEKTCTSPLTDFSVELDIEMEILYYQQNSKMELYLLDGSGNKLAKVAYIKGDYNVVNPQFYAKIYHASGGGNTYMTTGSDSSASISRNRPASYYYNTGGLLKIKVARRGTNWRIYVGKIDQATGLIYNQDLFEFTDTSGTFRTTQLNKVRMTCGTHNNPAGWTTGCYFHTLYINQENYSSFNPSTNVPYVFENGDVLQIDTSTASIYKNGVKFLDFFDVNSDFFKLATGNNYLDFYPSAVINSSTSVVYTNHKFL